MSRSVAEKGCGLIRDFGEVDQLQVSRKGPGDFVSAADLKAEQTVQGELKKGRPEFGFLMEESGHTEGSDKSHTWIVDPLDGTTNFLHGLPHFCVSIALAKDKEVIAGVIFDPVKDEVFWAERGIGAFVNSRRLRVSGRRRLEDSIIATGAPFNLHEESIAERFIEQLRPIMQQTSGIRRYGSAALDLAYVAAGRMASGKRPQPWPLPRAFSWFVKPADLLRTSTVAVMSWARTVSSRPTRVCTINSLRSSRK